MKINIHSRLMGQLAAGVLLLSGNTSASFIGDMVTCSSTAALRTCNLATAQVTDPGAEFMLGPQLSVDIFASSIVISQVAGTFGIPSSEILTTGDMQWIGSPQRVIDGVTLGTISNLVTPPTQSSLSFTSDSVIIDIKSATWGPGSSFEVLIQTAFIPIPSAVWLFSSGLLGMLGVARRKSVA